MDRSVDRRIEDSPGAGGPSNLRARSLWRALGEACRVAGASEPSAEKVGRLLELALGACDAERAFLIRETSPASEDVALLVEACRIGRADGRERPSRTLAVGVLRRMGAFVSTNLDSDRRIAQGASIRSLELRRVLAAPLPGTSHDRRVLVLDSRVASMPSTPEEAIGIVEAFAALLALVEPGRNDPDRPEPQGAGRRPEIVGRSAAMSAALAWARRVARSNLPVLVRGETGSGKEGIARLIHDDSPRGRGPFVAFNCTALAETLVEAELFGSTRGAYTGAFRDRRGLFQLAHGGTLLLDEVGDMPPATQAKLLRALQENRIRPVGGETDIPFDVRIIAATHRNLEHRVEAGRFRRDLFYRLAVVQIDVPPLRARMGDLPQLVDSLASRLERETGCGPLILSRRALAVLRSHDWPGNVRELHAVLARAMLRAGGAPIEDFHLGRLKTDHAPVAGGDDGMREGLERRMIESALRNSDAKISNAAREIGWTRQKLYRRMKVLGIDITEA